MIPRKQWTTYTPHEIDIMKTAVTHAHPDEYFTVEYAAAYLGVSSSTLQSWRSNKTGKLLYAKFGNGVRYRKGDLQNYLEQNMRLSTSTAA